ncbi:hypothetical protein JL722_7575 [Aureococcus anophagefferens]|nr:hypothetical protein JL722_7575 [Aureococcus anophagefferens]
MGAGLELFYTKGKRLPGSYANVKGRATSVGDARLRVVMHAGHGLVWWRGHKFGPVKAFRTRGITHCFAVEDILQVGLLQGDKKGLSFFVKLKRPASVVTWHGGRHVKDSEAFEPFSLVFSAQTRATASIFMGGFELLRRHHTQLFHDDDEAVPAHVLLSHFSIVSSFFEPHRDPTHQHYHQDIQARIVEVYYEAFVEDPDLDLLQQPKIRLPNGNRFRLPTEHFCEGVWCTATGTMFEKVPREHIFVDIFDQPSKGKPYFTLGATFVQVLLYALWTYTPASRGPHGGPSTPGLDVVSAWPDCEDQRSEVWRYWGYQFVHGSNAHITFNALVQMATGIPSSSRTARLVGLDLRENKNDASTSYSAHIGGFIAGIGFSSLCFHELAEHSFVEEAVRFGSALVVVVLAVYLAINAAVMDPIKGIHTPVRSEVYCCYQTAYCSGFSKSDNDLFSCSPLTAAARRTHMALSKRDEIELRGELASLSYDLPLGSTSLVKALVDDLQSTTQAYSSLQAQEETLSGELSSLQGVVVPLRRKRGSCARATRSTASCCARPSSTSTPTPRSATRTCRRGALRRRYLLKKHKIPLGYDEGAGAEVGADEDADAAALRLRVGELEARRADDEKVRDRLVFLAEREKELALNGLAPRRDGDGRVGVGARGERAPRARGRGRARRAAAAAAAGACGRRGRGAARGGRRFAAEREAWADALARPPTSSTPRAVEAAADGATRDEAAAAYAKELADVAEAARRKQAAAEDARRSSADLDRTFEALAASEKDVDDLRAEVAAGRDAPPPPPQIQLGDGGAAGPAAARPRPRADLEADLANLQAAADDGLGAAARAVFEARAKAYEPADEPAEEPRRVTPVARGAAGDGDAAAAARAAGREADADARAKAAAASDARPGDQRRRAAPLTPLRAACDEAEQLKALVDRLEHSRAACKAETRRALEDVERARRAALEAKGDAAKAAEAANAKEGTIRRLEASLHALDSERDALEDALRAKSEARVDDARRAKALERSLGKRDAEHASSAQRLQALGAALDDARRAASDRQELLDASQDDLRMMTKENQAVHAELAARRWSATALHVYRATCREKQAAVVGADESTRARQDLEHRLQAALDTITSLEGALTDAKRENQKRATVGGSLERELDAAARDRAVDARTVDALRAEVAKLQSDKAALHHLHAARSPTPLAHVMPGGLPYRARPSSAPRAAPTPDKAPSSRHSSPGDRIDALLAQARLADGPRDRRHGMAMTAKEVARTSVAVAPVIGSRQTGHSSGSSCSGSGSWGGSGSWTRARLLGRAAASASTSAAA